MGTLNARWRSRISQINAYFFICRDASLAFLKSILELGFFFLVFAVNLVTTKVKRQKIAWVWPFFFTLSYLYLLFGLTLFGFFFLL